MKNKQIPYLEQLLELGKLYKVDEIKLYAKSKKKLTIDEQEAELKDLFRKYVDISIIARAVLGKSWRQANSDQRTRFIDVFKTYVSHKYGRQFSEFKGTTLKIMKSRDTLTKAGVLVSSIVVVPPAESIVRFPEAVSISLSPVTPIWTLSILAPPFASSAPVKVVAPVTPKVPPTVVAPPPVANWVAPEESKVVTEVSPVTSKVLLKVVAPVTAKVSPTVANPVTARSSPTVKSSPIVISSLTPTPPVTTKAPEVELVDAVPEVIVVSPETPKVLL